MSQNGGGRMNIIVTGGAGFVGSALVDRLMQHTDHEVLVVDALTYAGTWRNLHGMERNDRLAKVKGDIGDRELVARLLAEFEPDVVINLAAETHVDRSIDEPGPFVATNILGGFGLLEETRMWWSRLTKARRDAFRFIQVSTDEVFGSLGETGRFDAISRYDPHSPYSASKAASDHLVRAWGHTYGLPVIVTHCSNNYGPRQYPEKLIPLTIRRAIAGLSLPVYGDGGNIRDWLAVEDHAAGLLAVIERGRSQATYMFGGGAERTNLQVVTTICAVLDRLRPQGAPHARLIALTQDRPGHDRRYAVDFTQTCREIGFEPSVDFDQGLERTVAWFLEQGDPTGDAAQRTRRLGLDSVGRNP